MTTADDHGSASDPRKELVYKESVRALEQQEKVLTDIRSRTGVLVATAAITSTFLGNRALGTADSAMSTWSWAAIAAFAVTGALCLVLLVQRHAWVFSHSVDALYDRIEKHDDWRTLDGVYERLAKLNQQHWASNKKKLDVMLNVLTAASFALVVEVVCWIVDLTN